MDKSHEQAQVTRQQNQAVRAALRAEREQDKALVLEVVRDVLKDKEATTAQRLFAVAVLDNLQYYHFVPYDVRHFIKVADASKIDAEIMERLEQIKNKSRTNKHLQRADGLCNARCMAQYSGFVPVSSRGKT